MGLEGIGGGGSFDSQGEWGGGNRSWPTKRKRGEYGNFISN